jgi:hypothetical protein
MRKRCEPQPSMWLCPIRERPRLHRINRFCHVSHASTSAGTPCSYCIAAPCREARPVHQHLHCRHTSCEEYVREQSADYTLVVLRDL